MTLASTALLTAKTVAPVLTRTYMLQNSLTSFFGVGRPLAVFDAIIEEEPTYTAMVTKHPVESGTEVTDHIQLQNPTLTLKGTMSNTPLDLAVSIANAAAGAIDLVTDNQSRSNLLNSGLSQATGIAGAFLLGGSVSASAGSAISAATDAIARTILLSAFQSKQIVDIVTKRQKYTSMAIQSLSFPRDQDTGFQLKFEMSLIQIRIVTPLTVSLSSLGESVLTGGASVTKLGSQIASGVSPATSSGTLTTLVK